MLTVNLWIPKTPRGWNFCSQRRQLLVKWLNVKWFWRNYCFFFCNNADKILTEAPYPTLFFFNVFERYLAIKGIIPLRHRKIKCPGIQPLKW